MTDKDREPYWEPPTERREEPRETYEEFASRRASEEREWMKEEHHDR